MAENEKKINKSYDLSSLESFKKNSLVGTNPKAYNDALGSTYRQYERLKEYTREDIDRIINSGNIDAQRDLSRNYFVRDGAYKGYIMYYATLLKYAGILIPNPMQGQSLSNTTLKKKYIQAVDFVDRIPIKIFCTNCAQKALVDGSYFGLIQTLDKNTFSYLDLPTEYCRSRFKDTEGNDLIEFNVHYFDSISDERSRQIALNAYPEFISEAYKKWKVGKLESKWVLIPAEIGICFPMVDGHPYFLSVVPELMDLSIGIEVSKERDLEEIRKIIVQKIPHNNENVLLFEPDEAVEIHNGTVEMMKGNKNISVLTTYADVDSIISKTASDSASDTVDSIKENVAREATISDQLFASNGSTTLKNSIKKDVQIMMTLANKFSLFITNLVNRVYANTNLSFTYKILPISEQLKEEYIQEAKDLASLGYSWILPAVAMDLSQKELLNIKVLENDVLKLQDQLIPLQSSYTQSANEEKAGAPKKENEDKAEQTIKNETSNDNVMGGSKDGK